jgi:hypothetical protein
MVIEIATTKVLRVTRQMLGYPRPKGDSRRKLQFSRARPPTGDNPSMRAEKELSSSQE